MKVNAMDVRAVIAMTLLLYVAAEDFPVTFQGDNFTMDCPGEEKLHRHGSELLEYTVQYNNLNSGLYKCEKGTRYFYVKANLCLNCFEVDGALFAQVIAVDMTGTIILMIAIYKFTKMNRSAGYTKASKAPARPGSRAPPVPSPDYEPLNPHTRGQDPYSVVNRMG